MVARLSGGDGVCAAGLGKMAAWRHMANYVERCGCTLRWLVLLLLLLLVMLRGLLLFLVWLLVVLIAGHSTTQRATGTTMCRLGLLLLWGPVCASARR